MWIKMNEYADNYTISAVFNCLDLWDLDIRGGHKYLWRIRLLGTPLFVIGWPLSPFSHLRPAAVNVLRRADPNIRTPDPPVYKILNANESRDYT
ncbi:Protein O-linked-mannose beta-1,2-N-acetylglucosaminyltransferase 1 [Halocaridina rubra]|uniref:Protein O-linked-mannose beta-1,2-N-acetylglucosaminyltransferase 1 n=1 Tax=Halocaridina rubra TaxID=373956 RepID=A0AAN8XMC2_HALRR